MAFLSFTNRHYFRHAVELKDQCKGGYLEAVVSLPPNAPNSCWIEISLAPADHVNDGLYHPLLLHLARPKNLFGNEQSPFSVSKGQWRLFFRKEGQSLFFEDTEIGNAIQVVQDTGELALVFGKDNKSHLLLQVISPLQRGSQGITVKEVLSDISAATSILAEKKGPLNKARLRVKIPDVCEIVSEPLLNLKDKANAELEIDSEAFFGFGSRECLFVLKKPVTGVVTATRLEDGSDVDVRLKHGTCLLVEAGHEGKIVHVELRNESVSSAVEIAIPTSILVSPASPADSGVFSPQAKQEEPFFEIERNMSNGSLAMDVDPLPEVTQADIDALLFDCVDTDGLNMTRKRQLLKKKTENQTQEANNGCHFSVLFIYYFIIGVMIYYLMQEQ